MTSAYRREAAKRGGEWRDDAEITSERSWAKIRIGKARWRHRAASAGLGEMESSGMG